MRGRKPKARAVKAARGNPGKRPIGVEPEAESPQSLEPPIELSEDARKVWDNITQRLSAWGNLDAADLHLLVGFANAMGRHIEAERKLSKEGAVYTAPSGLLKESPWVKISIQSLNAARLIAANFGFDPTSRARLGATGQTEDDPLDHV